MDEEQAEVGSLWTYNDGKVGFVVLFIEEGGHPMGLAFQFARNQHGTPAIMGHFDVQTSMGVAAGLMHLPRGAGARRVTASELPKIPLFFRGWSPT